MITETSTRKIGDVDIVDIAGRLSLGNTLVSIETAILNLIEQGSRRLVINIPGLTAIDSAGVGMLMGCSGQMEQAHGKLRIAGAQGAVARTFEVVHMDRVAAVDVDVDTACRAREYTLLQVELRSTGQAVILATRRLSDGPPRLWSFGPMSHFYAGWCFNGVTWSASPLVICAHEPLLRLAFLLGGI